MSKLIPKGHFQSEFWPHTRHSVLRTALRRLQDAHTRATGLKGASFPLTWHSRESLPVKQEKDEEKDNSWGKTSLNAATGESQSNLQREWNKQQSRVLGLTGPEHRASTAQCGSRRWAQRTTPPLFLTNFKAMQNLLDKRELWVAGRRPQQVSTH